MPPALLHVTPNRPHLFGAADGQRDIEALVKEASMMTGRDLIIVLDLKGAVAITGSYLRATVLWALLCGQADVRQEPTATLTDKWSLRPLPLFPVVTGCTKEIADEIHDFFSQRNLAILSIDELDGFPVKKAMLLGRLDTFLASTLHALAQMGEATAGQLAERSAERITVNGWSNRLSDLYTLRLVMRRRSGKFWIYSPIAKELTTWA